MKILMLTDHYPPSIGGGGKHVQSLSKQLVRMGHDVSVFTIGYCREPRFEEGVEVYRSNGFFQKIPLLYADPEMKWHPPAQDPLIFRKLKKIIEKEKPDIIHTHSWILFSYLPLKKKTGIPLVHTLHSYSFICPKKNLLTGNTVCDRPFTNNCITCAKKDFGGLIKSFFAYYGVRLYKEKLGIVDKFIAVSSFVRQVHLRHLGLSDEDIVLIPNFYSERKENPESKETGRFPKDFILFVGLLHPIKGISTLIEAYKRIDTETKLVMIGTRDPNYQVNGGKKTIVIKNAPYETVMKAFRKCKFVIIPSIWPDPCPTVAFEAMSCKKAVVASYIGGLRDIIQNEKTGVFFPPNDHKKLATIINRLLGEPVYAEELGLRGYSRFMEKFSADEVVPRVEEVYKEVYARAIETKRYRNV